MGAMVRLVQFSKVPLLINKTEFGTVAEVRLEQPLNAYPPIEVTELGMVIVVRLLQFRNTP